MGAWLTFFINLAIFVAAELLRPNPKIENAKPKGLGDFNFPTATEQRPLPLLWGTTLIEGPNVVWFGDLRAIPIKEKIKTGIFTSKTIVQGYRYELAVQFALCQGDSNTELLRVWVKSKSKLLFDAVADTGSAITHGESFEIDKPDILGGGDFGTGGITGTWEFYAGTDDQGPSPYLLGNIVDGASIASAGTGYEVGNYVDVVEGDGEAVTAARFRIVEVDTGASNAVTKIEAATGETYTVLGVPTTDANGQRGRYVSRPSDPAATSKVAGLGPASTPSGLTLNLQWRTPKQVLGSNGKIPHLRGVCFLIPFQDRAWFGNSTNIDRWLFELKRIPNGLALTGGKEEVDGGANPANVLYEILTDKEWGYGEPTGDMDVPNLTAAASTLFDEGNGFSFHLDREIDMIELVQQIEAQIDGILFKNPLTEKWQLKLIRDDYDIDLVPELTDDNIIQIRTFNQGTWEGTVNEVRVPFVDGEDSYKESYGFDQDMANVRILGKVAPAQVSHPGVKRGALANALASRELRTLSIPLAQGSWETTRELYGVMPGDVVAFTSEALDHIKLPIRVRGVDYGDLIDGKITIKGVQNVFRAAAGSFGDPPATEWVDPVSVVAAIEAAEQLAFEAPRAFTDRDPATALAESDKVFCAGRLTGSAALIDIVQRHTTGTPAGAFVEFGEIGGGMLVGELAAALSISATNPATSVSIVGDPDAYTQILSAVPPVLDVTELGAELSTLILVGNEFMLFETASAAGVGVTLSNVYRGVLDSVQEAHAVGDPVYLIFVAGNLADDAIPAGDTVDVKLLPKGIGASVAEGAATAIRFTMANRTRRPYPVASFDLNGTTLDATSVDLDGSGSGEDVGILVDEIVRRDFRTTDEIAALATDAATLFVDFPTANSTTVEVEVRNGVTVLASSTGISGTSTTMRQLDILAGLDTTTLPASLTIGVRQSHTLDAVVYKSWVWFDLDFTVDSDLVGKHAFGELDENEEGAIFVLADGGTSHLFSLSSAFTTGDVEYELNNSGSWLTLIAAGATTGGISHGGLTTGDDLRVRHTSTDTSPQKLLTMTVGGTVAAYAVLIS